MNHWPKIDADRVEPTIVRADDIKVGSTVTNYGDDEGRNYAVVVQVIRSISYITIICDDGDEVDFSRSGSVLTFGPLLDLIFMDR